MVKEYLGYNRFAALLRDYDIQPVDTYNGYGKCSDFTVDEMVDKLGMILFDCLGNIINTNPTRYRQELSRNYLVLKNGEEYRLDKLADFVMFRDNKFTLDLNAASRHLKIEKLL
jgi:hypothetical protein